MNLIYNRIASQNGIIETGWKWNIQLETLTRTITEASVLGEQQNGETSSWENNL